MSEFKDLYNPDFHKYGLGEVDYHAPTTTPEEAEPPVEAAQNETVASRLKAFLQKIGK